MKGIRIPFLGRLLFVDRNEGFLYFSSALYGRLIRGDHSPTVQGKRELGLGILGRKEWARQLALENQGVLLSRRVVTNAGVAFLVDDWDNNATDITNFNFHGNGTGTNAENVADTALQTEVETRASGTKSQPTANQLQTVGTIAITATRAITEHGLFSASSGPTLWDRSVFSPINVVNGDSIQFTYILTVQAGG